RGVSFRTKNHRQRRRAIWFWVISISTFTLMLFLDYLLHRYDAGMAGNIRKAADGIGWIFQFGMGYTFFMPFAIYMTGLLCWSYTVIKLLNMGRLAGYALLYSNLTLMVVLGAMLLTMDRQRRDATDPEPATNRPMVSRPDSLVGGHVS